MIIKLLDKTSKFFEKKFPATKFKPSHSDGEETQMRRFLLLIFALLLMLDLADDGCLGKAKFVSPLSPPPASADSSHKTKSGQGDFWLELPPADSRGNLNHFGTYSVKVSIQHDFIIKYYHHISSSGGLPL